MEDLDAVSAFGQAAKPRDSFVLDPAILTWFKARGAGWQNEINGVLSFYIETVEHPASEPAPVRIREQEITL